MSPPNADPHPRPEAAALITQKIADLGDWRGDLLQRVRQLIHEADPGVVETWKWRGTPGWEHDGILCTGESYKATVKLTFARGASLPDPSGLFNASLTGETRRAIDLHEGDVLPPQAFTLLIHEAVALNEERKASRARTGR